MQKKPVFLNRNTPPKVITLVLLAGLSALSFWSSRYWVFYAGEKDAGKR